MDYRLFFEKTQPYKKELGLIEGEPMYRHTTFQIGGAAEVFVQPRNLGAFMTALQAARESGLPLTVIGRGSNLLVRDEGVPGVVLCTCGMNGVRVEGCRVIAEAGASMAQFAYGRTARRADRRRVCSRHPGHSWRRRVYERGRI